MQRKTSDPAQNPRREAKRSRLRLGKQQGSPLKQRMEAVLKGDRTAIRDPLAHAQALYFAD
ncbi:MAG: hypothetical protein WCD18_21570 [Thermosynechococcaceae cyanobacterium]